MIRGNLYKVVFCLGMSQNDDFIQKFDFKIVVFGFYRGFPSDTFLKSAFLKNREHKQK
uniref:Uncharacterized protein n=1 Tax=Leptospira santarosai serovar Arenal str. MAVJ 401 TaxID=1049976 RepID=M6JTR3_9LEPT|nr:hypothetical protein LEP1GSC063_3471 [Leptospira santarosai serovar Arenal str. MAVJ 401]